MLFFQLVHIHSRRFLAYSNLWPMFHTKSSPYILLSSVNQSRAVSQPPLRQPSGRMCVVREPSGACLLCQWGVCCSVG